MDINVHDRVTIFPQMMLKLYIGKKSNILPAVHLHPSLKMKGMILLFLKLEWNLIHQMMYILSTMATQEELVLESQRYAAKPTTTNNFASNIWRVGGKENLENPRRA